MPLTGPNTGVAIWVNPDDLYNHEQLADNWAKFDWHDHSIGRGTQIPTEGIKDGAITAAKLAPGANIIQDASVIPSKFGTLPAAKAYNSAETALASGFETTLNFDSERFDNANVHDTATNTNRLTAPIAGVYIITLSYTTNVAPTASATIRAGIYKNGTVDANALARNGQAPGLLTHTLTTFTRLAVGDWVTARILNLSGGAVNVSAGSATAEDLNDFGIQWLAP